MAVESDENADLLATEEKNGVFAAKKKKKRGVFSRIWNGLFRRYRDDDFEEKLKHISKEEAAIVTRIKKRSERWRVLARNLIVFSLIFEVVAVSYAIVATRTIELNWKTRALRVLPMFLLPALSSIVYLAHGSLIQMRNHRDETYLERLKEEMQENLDELKAINNYYRTQELIQKYDTDPASRAAAATILASRLSADSGMRLHIEAESDHNLSQGRSNDVEIIQSSGLRQRRHLTRSNSNRSTIVQQDDDDMPHEMETMSSEISSHSNQVITEHHQPGSTPHDGGWFARVAAMLVGEDPMQCFALICGNCLMHNGLARKEDFPYVTYYCPHCNALNQSNNLEANSDFNQPSISSSVPTSNMNRIQRATVLVADNELVKSLSVEASLESIDSSNVHVSDDPKSDN